LRHPLTIRPIVLALFFVSGVAGLLYQVSWTRQIGGLLGNTVDTSAYVIFSFMSGMSLGYWKAGAKQTYRPLFWYGVLELGAAAWTYVVPMLVSLASNTVIAGIDRGPLGTYSLIRIIFCLSVLLPATVCLGATWPMMVRFLSRASSNPSILNPSTATQAVPWGYALNTVGAILGSIIGSAVLIANAGVITTSFVGGGLSALCGCIALVISFRAESTFSGHCNSSSVIPPARSINQTPPLRCWILVALSGAGILALEVLYLRLFSLVFHNSTYSFGLVLAVFLLALALGAALVSLLGLRFSTARLTAFGCAYGGLSIGLSLIVFARATNFDYFHADSFRSYLSKGAGLVGIVVLLPVVFLGMILPSTWRAQEGTALPPRYISLLTALSTISGAVGALGASFILPRLGLWASFLSIATIFFMAGTFSFFRQGHRSHAVLLAGILFAVGWVGLETSRKASTLRPGNHLVRRWESAYGWIDLVSLPDESLQVRQNLHYSFGSTNRSALRDYRQGHLPLLLHPRARHTLYLGLGTGQTASAALAHRNVESITICELIPEAVEAARSLESNRGLLSNPRVDVKFGDARKFLRDSGRKFDVIVSDLFVPWESQTGYLYTVEQYRAGLHALNDGGLFCQWLPVYQLSAVDFETIANSFASVFPYTTLWWAELDADRAVIGLLGSRTTLDFLSTPAANGLVEHDSITKRQDLVLATGNGILSLYLGDWYEKPAALLNTEEHPRVEFSAPVHHVNNTKLRGRLLEEYFDNVLCELSSSNNLVLVRPDLPMAIKQKRVQFQRVEMLK
jgi:spermidine synthase